MAKTHKPIPKKLVPGIPDIDPFEPVALGNVTSQKGGGKRNSAPTDILVSDTQIEADASLGSVVGVLSAMDPDPGDRFRFSVVDGAGGLMSIQNGNQLVISDSKLLDAYRGSTVKITLKVTDKAGATYQEIVEFFVAPADGPGPQAPTDIRLSSASVAENSLGGTEVGRLSAIDPDGTGGETYALIDDAGGRFRLDGNRLLVARDDGLDYETSRSHAVTVEVTDETGLKFRETLTVSVTDIDETVPAPGSVAAPSYVYDALIPRVGGDAVYRWNVDAPLGTGVVIKYAFLESVPSYYGATAEERQNFKPFSAAQRDVALEAFKQVASFSNLTFVETSAAEAMITFGTADFAVGSGYAYLPGYGSLRSGDVWIDNSVTQNNLTAPGESGYKTIFHEIGHALGLKHPHESPALTDAEDSRKFTVMSYSAHPNSVGVEPHTFMSYDIAALQYLYGVGNGGLEDNVYAIGSLNRYIGTIWDAGGIDTLDASTATVSVTINLLSGAFTSAGLHRSWYPAVENLSIAYGTVLENAIGGAGNDVIIGNAVANRLDGGRGNDQLTGGAGADIFVFGRSEGFDTITDFEVGIDVMDIADWNVTDIGQLLLTDLGQGRVTVADGNGNAIEVRGATGTFAVADLTPSDFVFSDLLA